MLKTSIVRHWISCSLVALLSLPSVLCAQTHVVSPADLRQETLAASSARQRNLQTIDRFLSSTPQGAKALGAVGVDATEVKSAVSSLNDQELARLAARAQNAQSDFAAGRISDRDLLLIVLGFAALILIIVAVR